MLIGMAKNGERTETIYNFISEYIQREGFAPTYREIAESCNCAAATVAYHIRGLAARGRIVRAPGRARSVTLVSKKQA